MPWGLTRFHHSGQSHFVTFCCYHRRRLLTTDASRRIFESALERVRRGFRLQVYGYAVMPEHVHLLLSEPQRDSLADALKSLKQGVSRRLIGDADRLCLITGILPGLFWAGVGVFGQRDQRGARGYLFTLGSSCSMLDSRSGHSRWRM